MPVGEQVRQASLFRQMLGVQKVRAGEFEGMQITSLVNHCLAPFIRPFVVSSHFRSGI
jgi:hypothetical protein